MQKKLMLKQKNRALFFTSVLLSMLLLQLVYFWKYLGNTLIYQAQAQPATSIPVGTVTAFDLAACPSGWTEYTAARGRFVMGTNPSQFSNPSGVGNIRALTLNATAGAEIHTVTTAQMPTHNHWGSTTNPTAVASVMFNTVGSMAGGGWGAVVSTTGTRWAASNTALQGGGAAHNNMPPFVALLYCQKT